MRQANSAAQSGWGWGSGGPPSTPVPPPRPPRRRGRGGAELALAIVVFLGVLGGIAALVSLATVEGDDDEAGGAQSADGMDASAEVSDPAGAQTKRTAMPRSLETIVWTTDVAFTLEELGRTWSIPEGTLAELNPKLSPDQPIPVGTKVVVYSHAQGPSASIGPPNDGTLSGAMPLPEGKAWLLPEDRGRAFATTETITALVSALETYGRRFPDAAPIQVGDLSARRGGSIYGHQSHQSGRDVDIRLILADDGESFDAARTWFLVKTLVDDSPVREIFLNRSEQPWLRAAAEADVGATEAERYFELIEHEPGHTIHMHVRFDCPESDRRCVGYSMSGEGEADPVRKLPLSPGGSKASGGVSKLPGKNPKSGTSTNTTKKTKKKLTKTKKKR